MIKSFGKFFVILTSLLIVSFVVHVLVLHLKQLPLFDNSIIGCYAFNYIIAAFTYLFLVLFQDKLASSLGFVFMGGSLLKFALFFLLFYPSFNQDQEVSKLEFASFFTPYAISLIVEVVFLSKTLNK